MYEAHFGFWEKPFSLSPDPAFLYMGEKHRMAYAMLEYGMRTEAPLVVISGEIGSGKTTLIRHLLNSAPKETLVGLISNTHAAFGDLMQSICLAFSLPFESENKVALYNSFINFLIDGYGKGRRVLLVFDEAQNMDAAMLEELRVLSNINADKKFLLQIVLAGQPELRKTLRDPRLEQFAQRVAVDYHLQALDQRETKAYVAHRLLVAGGEPGLFSDAAVDLVHELSKGVPRIINTLCDTALVYAFADEKHVVDEQLIRDFVREREERGLFGGGKLHYPAAGNE